MIAYDRSQAQHITHPESWKSCDILEKVTGGDYLVSPLSLPVKSPTLIAKHLSAGGILVQLKLGSDLATSIDDGRFAESICRMHEFEALHSLCLKPAQRFLLPIGIFIERDTDELWINGNIQRAMTYSRFIGSLEKWTEWGGATPPIPPSRKSKFVWFLEMKERHLKEIKAEPVIELIAKSQELYEASNTPLQTPIRVRDGRRTLITFPGVGPKTANEIWKDVNGILGHALIKLSEYPKIHGYMGLNQDAVLGLESRENLLKRNEEPQ